MPIDRAVEAIASLRRNGARVHCITNDVARNFTANILLACGATPSMTSSPAEVAEFTKEADSLLVNLGTLEAERAEAIRIAAAQARETGVPFVLDPVKIDMSQTRLAFAKSLLDQKPAILRVNAAEASAIGIEDLSGDELCIAQTGSIDTVRMAGQTITSRNGVEWMDRVTAVGCAQGALMAALLTHASTPLDAALAAILWFGIAGEHAARSAGGPGTFVPLFLDRLYDLPLDAVRTGARLA